MKFSLKPITSQEGCSRIFINNKESPFRYESFYLGEDVTHAIDDTKDGIMPTIFADSKQEAFKKLEEFLKNKTSNKG